MAGNHERWLTLAKAGKARGEGLRSVHVIGSGREQVVVVCRGRPNPRLEARSRAARAALGNDPRAVEALGQPLAECAAGRAEAKGSQRP